MIKQVRKLVTHKNPNQVKVLVHCSAGVGRTGTFIALYQLMELLDEKVSEYRKMIKHSSTGSQEMDKFEIDVFNTVFTLRRQRCQMVRREFKNF